MHHPDDELLKYVLKNNNDDDPKMDCASKRPQRMAGEAIEGSEALRDIVSAGGDARIDSPGKEDDRNVVIHNYSNSPVVIQSKGSSCDF